MHTGEAPHQQEDRPSLFTSQLIAESDHGNSNRGMLDPCKRNHGPAYF